MRKIIFIGILMAVLMIPSTAYALEYTDITTTGTFTVSGTSDPQYGSYLIDNNITTYWRAADYSQTSYFQWTFTEPVHLGKISFYQSTGYGFKGVGVRVYDGSKWIFMSPTGYSGSPLPTAYTGSEYLYPPDSDVGNIFTLQNSAGWQTVTFDDSATDCYIIRVQETGLVWGNSVAGGYHVYKDGINEVKLYSAYLPVYETSSMDITSSNITSSTADITAEYTFDDNENNSCSIFYRKYGDLEWLPLSTTRVDGTREWNASVDGLTSNTNYEIRAEFSDPDGFLQFPEYVESSFTTTALNETQIISWRGNLITATRMDVTSRYIWDTNENNSAVIYYSDDAGSSWTTATVDPTINRETKTYTYSISGLTKDTNYVFKIVYSDADGIVGDSEATFGGYTNPTIDDEPWSIPDIEDYFNNEVKEDSSGFAEDLWFIYFPIEMFGGYKQ